MNRDSTKAQMSVDFLLGMVIFAGVFFFIFQFSAAAVSPFVFTSEEVPTKTQSVADNLYFDKLSDGEKGMLNLTYLEENNESIQQLEADLGVERPRHGMNVTVSEIDSDDPPDFAVDDDGSTNSPPEVGASVSRTVRYGQVADDGGIDEFEEGDKVFVRVRVW